MISNSNDKLLNVFHFVFFTLYYLLIWQVNAGSNLKYLAGSIEYVMRDKTQTTLVITVSSLCGSLVVIAGIVALMAYRQRRRHKESNSQPSTTGHVVPEQEISSLDPPPVMRNKHNLRSNNLVEVVNRETFYPIPRPQVTRPTRILATVTDRNLVTDYISVRPNDGYVRPNDGYFRPNDGYERPNDGYVRPNDGFVSPNDGYVRPNDDYVRPNDGSGRPNYGCARPNDGFV